MHLQAQERPGLLAATEAGRDRKEPPPGREEGARPWPHLHFGLLASKREKTNV